MHKVDAPAPARRADAPATRASLRLARAGWFGASVVLLLVAWELAARHGPAQPAVLQPRRPRSSTAAFREVQLSRFWRDVGVSALSFTIGFGAAALIAVPLGLAIGSSRRSRFVAEPVDRDAQLDAARRVAAARRDLGRARDQGRDRHRVPRRGGLDPHRDGRRCEDDRSELSAARVELPGGPAAAVHVRHVPGHDPFDRVRAADRRRAGADRRVRGRAVRRQRGRRLHDQARGREPAGRPGVLRRPRLHRLRTAGGGGRRPAGTARTGIGGRAARRGAGNG